VVPAFNYGRYLGDCLRSIFSLEGEQDFEVIVIDDASSDDTQDVLKSFDDPRLRAKRHPQNMGHVVTVNEGLSEARGDFISRIDPDDRYRPCFLELTLPRFADRSDIGMVYGDAALIDESGTVTAERTDVMHGGRDFVGNELLGLLESNFVCAPTVIARRAAWLDAWPIPTGLAFNDWYFSTEMARRYAFYFVAEVLADYRVHGANHHVKVIRDRTEETSILWILNRLFQEREENVQLQNAKQRVRRQVFGKQYLTLADKYFGFGLDADARRCYLQAARYSPQVLRCPAVVRRLLGTIVGRRSYEAIKTSMRRVLAG
jgi:glycosyltransferase involved in cell wall biosynthesis